MYRHDLGARTQFVLVAVCGCPIAAIDGSQVPGADSAMRVLAGHNLAKVAKLEAEGYRVRHVPHEDYLRDYLPRMGPRYRCSHRGAS